MAQALRRIWCIRKKPSQIRSLYEDNSAVSIVSGNDFYCWV